MSRLTEATADGDVTTVTTAVHSVTLTGGSDVATAVLKAGGSSGTVLLTLKAAASTTVVWKSSTRSGVQFNGGIYVDVTGTGPLVYVETA